MSLDPHRQDPLSVCRLSPDLILACSALQLGGPVELTCIFRTEACKIGCGYCVAKRQSLVQLLYTKKTLRGTFFGNVERNFKPKGQPHISRCSTALPRRAPRRTVSYPVPLWNRIFTGAKRRGSLPSKLYDTTDQNASGLHRNCSTAKLPPKRTPTCALTNWGGEYLRHLRVANSNRLGR